MWFTEFWSVAVAVGMGVGVGVGEPVGPPADTPPQPESERTKTKQTRGHKTFRIQDPVTLENFDGTPEQRVVPSCCSISSWDDLRVTRRGKALSEAGTKG